MPNFGMKRYNFCVPTSMSIVSSKYGEEMGKSKGKRAASSSIQPEAEAQQKKRRLIRACDPESEEDAPPRGPKPDWTFGSLLDQPVEWQTDFFHEQMNKLQQRKEAFICKKEI
ncbi:hypothetical protein Hanom_Chr05g00400901 [Helianthus anomalus]